MTLASMLNVTDGCQKIRINNANSLKTIYEGQAFNAPFVDCDVVTIYTIENTIVISVV